MTSEINPNLSNITNVLIARLESHPKDFEYGGRFFELSQEIERAVVNPEVVGRLRSFPKADQEALMEIWRAKTFEITSKELMSLVFDEEWEERNSSHLWQSRTTTAQNAALQGWADPTAIFYGTANNVLSGAHPLSNQQSSAQNAAAAQNSNGLLGGIFKGIF
jgi:hypothetical protein